MDFTGPPSEFCQGNKTKQNFNLLGMRTSSVLNAAQRKFPRQTPRRVHGRKRAKIYQRDAVCVPLQILVDVVVAIVAGQPDQNAGRAAPLFPPTQAAVTHCSADRTGPCLQKRQDLMDDVVDCLLFEIEALII